MDDINALDVLLGLVLAVLSFGAGLGWRAGRWHAQHTKLVEEQQAAQGRISTIQGQLAETVRQVQAVVLRLDQVIERELSELRGQVEALRRADRRFGADLDQVTGAVELLASHVDLGSASDSVVAKLQGARARNEVSQIWPRARET